MANWPRLAGWMLFVGRFGVRLGGCGSREFGKFRRHINFPKIADDCWIFENFHSFFQGICLIGPVLLFLFNEMFI